jgi:hypothetical protein
MTSCPASAIKQRDFVFEVALALKYSGSTAVLLNLTTVSTTSLIFLQTFPKIG